VIRRYFLAALATTFLCGCVAKEPVYEATYYLVRHAEKTTEKPDPALTQAGEKRAQNLAARLENVPLTKIYSSNYKRTRDTAAPVAAVKGLNIVLYDPSDLEGFSKNLLSETGHILVVGHSNTTPNLSGLLGGKTGEPILEASEYDRFYILKKSGNDVSTKIERFGEKS